MPKTCGDCFNCDTDDCPQKGKVLRKATYAEYCPNFRDSLLLGRYSVKAGRDFVYFYEGDKPVNVAKLKQLGNFKNRKEFAKRLEVELDEFDKVSTFLLDFAEKKKVKTKGTRQRDKPFVDRQEDSQTIVDQLINIALESGVELFRDEREDAFVSLEGGGHREIHRVEGKVFERWLRKQYFEVEKKGLRREVLKDASATLAAMAQFQEPIVKRILSNRVAWHDEDIYYDLTDEKWRTIKISPEGWEVVDDPPPLFRRFPHQLAQVEPCRGGSLDEVLRFINVTDPKDQLLIKVYIVTCLVPDIPHPIMLVLGPQGSAKSDFMRAIRRLVDPSTILLLSFRYDELEMALKTYQHYLPYFDNLSSIKQWLSDILCRACTGQGFTKRRLYTDEDSVFFRILRCVGVNGIALSHLSPDFLDRCLTLILKQIPKEKRKSERKLWREFEEAKPRILGAMLSALGKAMAIFPTLKIKYLPRMADFAMWGEAAARALGYEPGEFLEAYSAKIGEQVKDVLEENPIGLAIMEFMQDKEEWEGAPSDLLERLEDEDFVKEHKIDVKADKWPKSANWVTRRVKEIEANLAHEGIKFESGKRVNRQRMIQLTKIEESGKEGEEEGIEIDSQTDSGDSSDSNDSISPIKRVKEQKKHVNKNNASSPKGRRNAVTVDIPSLKFGKGVLLQENLQAVLSFFSHAEKDGEGNVDPNTLEGNLEAEGVENPWLLILHLCSSKWRNRNRWWLELNASPPETLGEEGKCIICSGTSMLYRDVNNERPVCLECRFTRQGARSGVPWKVRLVRG